MMVKISKMLIKLYVISIMANLSGRSPIKSKSHQNSKISSNRIVNREILNLSLTKRGQNGVNQLNGKLPKSFFVKERKKMKTMMSSSRWKKNTTMKTDTNHDSISLKI